MSYAFALLTLACCIAVAAVVVWSEKNPDRALWPPRRFGWSVRTATWAVTIVAIGGAYMAGRLSWNAWHWPDWIRWYVGFPLAFASSSVSSWAIVRLGLDQSMGADNGLVTGGPYARSRNPTYIANLALCAGWSLLAASWPATIAAGSLAVLYIFTVPYEERWLARRYGDPYIAYRASVRRWL